MRIYFINIKEKNVIVNGQKCSFQEAGLGLNDGSSNVLENEDEIIEYLTECHEIEYPNEGININFI